MNKTLSTYIVISIDEFGNELWRQRDKFRLKLHESSEIRNIGIAKMHSGRLWYKKTGSHYHVNAKGYSICEMVVKELLEHDEFARILVRNSKGNYFCDAKKFLSEGKRSREEGLEVQLSLEVAEFDFTPLPRKVYVPMDGIL